MDAQTDTEHLRRQVVDAIGEFVRRSTQGHSVVEAIAAQHELPSYLVGLMNTAYLSAERWPISEATLRATNPGSERSRFGAEHWSLLVKRDLAKSEASGWTLTATGEAIVHELHEDIRSEVLRRKAPEQLVAAIWQQLAPIERGLPVSHRVAVIRAMWAGASSSRLLELYRTSWILFVQHRALVPEVFFAQWPVGAELRSLAEWLTELNARLA